MGIRRRDVVLGAATAPLVSSLNVPARAGTPSQSQGNANYPPTKTGMRGSHAGSFESSHQLAQQGISAFAELSTAEPDTEYDLVVVGGGISGLAAAYFYQAKQPGARILILDNHDDFGGHAKRNEFLVDGQRLIGYGGSQTMESPSAYSDVAKALLHELSVDLDGFEQAYDQAFFAKHGLRGGIFFDRETYGQSHFAPISLFGDDFLGMAPASDALTNIIAATPLSDADQAELVRLIEGRGDALPDVGLFELPEYLGGISYQTFLQQHLGITSQPLINLLMTLPSSYFGIGIDAIPAAEALVVGLPGIGQLGVPGINWLRQRLAGLADPYIHHFPDGNAGVARALVAKLVPTAATAVAEQGLVRGRINYAALDTKDQRVRIRLNSTALKVTRSKGPEGERAVVHYQVAGGLRRVNAKHAVLACYNMMIPHLCPELPTEQRQALASLVKSPLVYTNVALKNWRAMHDLKIGQSNNPNMFHQLMMMDFPVSMQGYNFSATPVEPVLLHMSTAFGAPGLPPKEQYRLGRAQLLGTSYATIEADIKNHLNQLLGVGGFVAEKDIAAITVNRWPHGYAYGYSSLHDPDYAPGTAPHEVGRRTWGPVAIANSDAGARAYMDEAIDQAHRAINELLP